MSSYVTRKTPGDTDWFVKDRFGMFIHFGLYAMAARHEWVKTKEKMSDEEYKKYFDLFNPDLYDPKDWARQAKQAGMKYVVLTTKHHEGFCLFETKYTDYNVMNTPYGKDIVREYVEAFRAEGIKVGFYYSLIDWHHPEFPIDMIHSMSENPDAFEINKTRDMSKYAEYMRNQVSELLTNYGKIDILWFDYSYSHRTGDGDKSWMKGKGKDDWEAEKLLKLARELQPHIIIDNRTEIEQDLWTPEQFQPLEWVRHEETGELVTWEACQTFSGSWGYYRDEATWKSEEMLIRMLINTVSLGGNLLMNVGPTGRGYFDYRAENALKAYSEWMKYNSRSIYDCTMPEPEFQIPPDCRMTQSNDGKRLYLHLYAYPFKNLKLYGYTGKIKYAQFLHDGSEILFDEGIMRTGFTSHIEQEEGMTALYLPQIKPNVVVPVIEIFLK